MDSILVLLVFLGVMMGLAVIRVPLALAILAGAMVGFWMTGRSFGIIAPSAFSALDVFAYLAVPGFLYAGALMLHGRIAAAILGLFHNLAQRFRGVLGSITVAVAMLFGTISGSSVATVSMVGGMMVPELVKRGFTRARAGALVAATGVLGVLLPPSIPGIVFAISAGQSVSAVWLTTVMPAILLALIWAVIAFFQGRESAQAEDRDQTMTPTALSGERKRGAFVHALPALAAPVLIFGGIYGGILTPTEAGATVVAYCLIIGFFVYKGLHLGNIGRITFEAARASASILIIISAAVVSARLFTLIGLPRELTAFVLDINPDPLMFILLMNILLLVIGMFMETNTAILILTPILLPIAQSLGIDPLHFGAMMLLNLELGMITPPLAANLFVACKIASVPFNKIMPPIMPYFLSGLFVLAITALFPAFSLSIVALLN